MARASRDSVPLNIMCSMKCETPRSSDGSSRAPFRTHAPTDTERRSAIDSDSTVRPEARTVLRYTEEVMIVAPSNVEWQVALPLASLSFFPVALSAGVHDRGHGPGHDP